MAARMPACYAAMYKVLEEVSMRLPTFTPQSMLDYGAGPGTAIWATLEVGFSYTGPHLITWSDGKHAEWARDAATLALLG